MLAFISTREYGDSNSSTENRLVSRDLEHEHNEYIRHKEKAAQAGPEALKVFDILSAAAHHQIRLCENQSKKVENCNSSRQCVSAD